EPVTIDTQLRPTPPVRPLRQAGPPHDTRPGDPADPCSESGAGAEATTGPGTGPTRSLSAAKTEAGYFSSAVAPASFSLATAFSASAFATFSRHGLGAATPRTFALFSSSFLRLR